MSRTVPILSETGRLVNAEGVDKESDVRYSKFSKRLLGDDGTSAVLNYGWNGKDSLVVSANGIQGQLLTLDSELVKVSGDLKIGNRYLQEIIDSCTDLAIRGIQGTDQQIAVDISENSDSSSEESRLKCTISLDADFLNRITTIEQIIDKLFRFDEVYKVGDGLEVLRDDYNRLRVKLGTGLKFEIPEESSSDSSSEPISTETLPITLDMDSTPTPGSVRPVTSGGVYEAIRSGGGTTGYTVGVDSYSGNMILYYNEEESESSSSGSSGV